MMNVEEVITEDLPKDWMIIKVMQPIDRDLEPRYIAFQYRTEIRKRWFRKPVAETAWKDAGFRSRWSDTTRDWIIQTDKEMKKNDLFDVTAKGHGHVSILLNGEVRSSTKVYGSPEEAVARATLRWGAGDSLTYDNAHYVSVTRRKES